jgi:plasmid replication initiation protein
VEDKNMVSKKPSIVKKQIIKSNNLIEGSYKLTMSENRLIDLALTNLEVAMLDKNLSAEEVKTLIKQKEFDEIEINVIDYKKEYGIKNNTIYEDLAQTAKRLYDRSLIYFENDDLVMKRWVITCKYKEDSCAVAIQFHPDLIPDLMIFKSCYTRFDFDVKKYIRSYYTCRIYELLKQYEAIGRRLFEIDQIRFLLGIEDGEYPEYSNFKQRILKPAVEQINKVTDLYCEFEEIKKKKKVEKIRFKFVKQSVNYQIKEQLSFLDNEVAITSEHNEYNIVKEFRELLGITISPMQIDKIIRLAASAIKKHNINLPIKEYIKQKKIVVDEYSKKTTIKSYLGAIIRAIQENWTLILKQDRFNDYEQREYDFDKLEKGLLGWDNADENNEFEGTPFKEIYN